MTPRNHGTTRFGSLRGGLIGLLAIAAMAAGGCEQALQVAPSSSVLVLTAPVSAVGLNTTVTITATLTDGTGKAVADGTLVTFASSLGLLNPPEARVANGRATTVLNSGTNAGVATVSAVSGGVTSNALAVRVGALPSRITVSASTSGSVATIVATVLDTTGAPVPGTPVTFTTSAGTLGYSAATTDAFGRAATTVFGTYDAVVTAEALGMRASVAISLIPTGTLSVNVAMSPTNPLRRQNITFTTTATVPGSTTVYVQRFEWLFSDGLFVTTTGNQTARAFENEGVYWVTVRVFTSDGSVGMSRIEFYVD